MDILAHGLWAAAACMLAERRVHLPPRTVAATVTLAVLPDLVHAIPVVAWALFGSGSIASFEAYAVAVPGEEPMMPPMVRLLSHHLHCFGHSAIAASVVTAAVWIASGSLWIPLLGWWLHILIDVFTHSSSFYPAPVLYPLTMRGFNGIAWNEPWCLVLNYVVLAALFAWIVWRRQGERASSAPPS
jgi:hypothetical protein